MVHHVSANGVSAQEGTPAVHNRRDKYLVRPAMLGSRAACLVDQTNMRNGPGTASDIHKFKTRTLATPVLLRAWWRVTRKLVMVLDVFHFKNCVTHAIGERPYKLIFGHLREEQRNFLDQESKPQGVMRIHDGQIMGNAVKDSLTQKTTEQAIRPKNFANARPPRYNKVAKRVQSGSPARTARRDGTGSRSRIRQVRRREPTYSSSENTLRWFITRLTQPIANTRCVSP